MCILETLPCSSAAWDHLILDGLICFLSLRVLCLHVCLNFSYSPMPRVEGRTSQVSPVSQTEGGPSTGPGGTNQQGFPLSFPIDHCLPPHSTYLKRHFWKVGHRLRQVVLGINHSCLSKHYYFCLETLMGIMASQKSEPK